MLCQSLEILMIETEIDFANAHNKTVILHRSSKQVRLTEAGDILYTHAKQIMHLYDEAKQSIRLLQHEVTGQIRLGASLTIDEYILPGMIADYAKQYPHVNIEVTIRNTCLRTRNCSVI